MRIGRPATSLADSNQGLGELMLKHAIERILHTRNTLGVHAVMVEAKNSAEEGFYRKYGFRLYDPESGRLPRPLGAEWPDSIKCIF